MKRFVFALAFLSLFVGSGVFASVPFSEMSSYAANYLSGERFSHSVKLGPCPDLVNSHVGLYGYTETGSLDGIIEDFYGATAADLSACPYSDRAGFDRYAWTGLTPPLTPEQQAAAAKAANLAASTQEITEAGQAIGLSGAGLDFWKSYNLANNIASNGTWTRPTDSLDNPVDIFSAGKYGTDSSGTPYIMITPGMTPGGNLSAGAGPYVLGGNGGTSAGVTVASSTATYTGQSIIGISNGTASYIGTGIVNATGGGVTSSGQMSTAISTAGGNTTNVTVTAPAVTVAPAQVTVNPQVVNVSAPVVNYTPPPVTVVTGAVNVAAPVINTAGIISAVNGTTSAVNAGALSTSSGVLQLHTDLGQLIATSTAARGTDTGVVASVDRLTLATTSGTLATSSGVLQLHTDLGQLIATSTAARGTDTGVVASVDRLTLVTASGTLATASSTLAISNGFLSTSSGVSHLDTTVGDGLAGVRGDLSGTGSIASAINGALSGMAGRIKEGVSDALKDSDGYDGSGFSSTLGRASDMTAINGALSTATNNMGSGVLGGGWVSEYQGIGEEAIGKGLDVDLGRGVKIKADFNTNLSFSPLTSSLMEWARVCLRSLCVFILLWRWVQLVTKLVI